MTPEEMAKFVGGFLNVEDVTKMGTNGSVTVSGSSVETVGKDKEKAVVLSFLEIPKKLVVNGPRVQALAKIVGDKENVNGKRIKLAIGRAPNGAQTIVVEAAS